MRNLLDVWNAAGWSRSLLAEARLVEAVPPRVGHPDSRIRRHISRMEAMSECWSAWPLGVV
jgi:hypothetical protein